MVGWTDVVVIEPDPDVFASDPIGVEEEVSDISEQP